MVAIGKRNFRLLSKEWAFDIEGLALQFGLDGLCGMGYCAQAFFWNEFA
jgi:hypothetical protein